MTLIKKVTRKVLEVRNILINKSLIAVNHVVKSNAKKVLVFTDSRGYEITKPGNKRLITQNEYVMNLTKKYYVDVVICPEKFTSIVDFIFFIESSSKEYDEIILHCGVVDFAPRPLSSYNDMYQSKKQKMDLLDIPYSTPEKYSEYYEGEDTLSFLSPTSLTDILVKYRSLFSKVTYISINRVLKDWTGHYWRERPQNINVQLEIETALIEISKRVVSLKNLTDDEIKEITVDNVHLSSVGFSYVAKQLSLLDV